MTLWGLARADAQAREHPRASRPQRSVPVLHIETVRHRFSKAPEECGIRNGQSVQLCVPTRLVQGVGDWRPLSGGFHSLDLREFHSLEFCRRPPTPTPGRGIRFCVFFCMQFLQREHGVSSRAFS